jgi:hypothetical protein
LKFAFHLVKYPLYLRNIMITKGFGGCVCALMH